MSKTRKLHFDCPWDGVRIVLIALAASSIGALPACGQSDPMRKQFAKDIKKQEEIRPGRIDEAFVSSWTNAAGEKIHATCMIYGRRERPISLVVSPHGDGIATLERGNLKDSDWVKYCSAPAADASGNPISKRRL